jgi:transcriptional regulator with XRE-family HTH domain
MYRMADGQRTGIVIRRARERKRWTQQQLADAVGVSRTTVDAWENNRTFPRNRAGALEQVLGIRLDGSDPAPAPAAEPAPAEWEAAVLADEDLPMEMRVQLIEDARRARRAYRARRARQAAEEREA